ncbi:hypothetical protein [uncultured Jatrophihabitans sp.]|uniref:hypothetical protein n=1 Tax=uncultured Jatrophihabitans sp. TaxID=1610747 RepID=UPI0035CB54FB
MDIEPGPPNTTFADLEGNRVGVVTVLTRYSPVGCRFYFANDSPRHAVGDILPYTFSSVLAAKDAMALIGRVDTKALGYPNFLPGVDGISFQTKFFRPDGNNDWAFVFVKARTVVLIHTDQTDTSADARNIAAQIAKHF